MRRRLVAKDLRNVANHLEKLLAVQHRDVNLGAAPPSDAHSDDEDNDDVEQLIARDETPPECTVEIPSSATEAAGTATEHLHDDSDGDGNDSGDDDGPPHTQRPLSPAAGHCTMQLGVVTRPPVKCSSREEHNWMQQTK